jgi:signal transduction histidine kinase
MRRILDLLRDEPARQEIIRECVAQSRAQTSSRWWDQEVVKDHLPEYLDELAAAMDQARAAGVKLEAVEKHVRNRIVHGFDVRDLIAEYQIVRSVILRVYQAQVVDGQTSLSDVMRLNETIDDSVRNAVDAFIAERESARDIFIGILGHDLRSPLQSISSAAELLVANARDEAMVQRVGCRIKASVTHMSELISGLLEFARIHLGGGIPIQRARLDLRTLVHDILEEVVLTNPARRIENKATTASGDFQGCFDATRVAQAVTNLVRNAIEHGGDPVVVELYDEGELVRIQVCNEGTIPADVKPHLFMPFARGRVGKGLGLGLFIASEIARAHGGRVVATEHDDRTCFSLCLRRANEGRVDQQVE